VFEFWKILYMLKSTSRSLLTGSKFVYFFVPQCIIPPSGFSIFSSQTIIISIGKKKNSFISSRFFGSVSKILYRTVSPLFPWDSSIATSFLFFYRRIKKHRTTQYIYIFIFYLILQTKSARIIFLLFDFANIHSCF
jgi:hypothetical protein